MGPGLSDLTPLAIAAVRGTEWAVDVAKARTSVLVIDGSVGVTNRRLNQYVIVTEGEGVDITPADTPTVQKTWGEDKEPGAARPFRRVNGDRAAWPSLAPPVAFSP